LWEGMTFLNILDSMLYGRKFVFVNTNNEDDIGKNESCFIDKLTSFKEISNLIVEACHYFDALLWNLVIIIFLNKIDR